MNNQSTSMKQIVSFLAWLGIWGAWVSHPAAGLTQNALDFTEWSTYLADVRYGDMRFSLNALRLGLGLLLVVLMLVNQRKEAHIGWRITIGLISFLTAILLFPPYPGGFSIDIVYFWFTPTYRTHFILSLITITLLIVSIFSYRLDQRTENFIISILVVISLSCISSGYFRLLGPFNAHYATNLYPGWGFIVSSVSLTLLGTIMVYGLFKKRKRASRY